MFDIYTTQCFFHQMCHGNSLPLFSAKKNATWQPNIDSNPSKMICMQALNCLKSHYQNITSSMNHMSNGIDSRAVVHKKTSSPKKKKEYRLDSVLFFFFLKKIVRQKHDFCLALFDQIRAKSNAEQPSNECKIPVQNNLCCFFLYQKVDKQIDSVLAIKRRHSNGSNAANGLEQFN